jgi:PAS domain S-box-containing protein
VRERVANVSAGHGNRDRELAIGRLHARIEHVLDMARDAFVETDACGVLTEWNRQSEVLFGWSRDEVLGRAVTDFLIPARHRAAAGRQLEMAGLARGAAERTRPRQVQLMHREGY